MTTNPTTRAVMTTIIIVDKNTLQMIRGGAQTVVVFGREESLNDN
jgi:hypothetical protein